MRNFALPLALAILVPFATVSSAQLAPLSTPAPDKTAQDKSTQDESAQEKESTPEKSTQEKDDSLLSTPVPDKTAQDKSTQDESAQEKESAPEKSPQEKDDSLLSFLTVLSHPAEEHSNQNHMSVGFQFTELYDSNPLNVLKRPRADEISSLNGSFGIDKKWEYTAITGNYSGGADYYNRLDNQNQTYHEASAAETFFLGPVTLLLGGDYELLPRSAFGFDATRQITSSSVNLINPDLLPSQSIQTRPLRRMSYTGVGQLSLQLGDHSQVDFSGTYGRLQYDKNGIAGTDQASGATGYSYAFSSRDRIGLSYQYQLFQTSGNPLQVIDEVVLASYAHRFGANLIARAGAGPDLRSYNNTKAKSLQGIDPNIAANAALDYSRGSTRLSVSYSRATTSGQGVLQGSESDQAEFLASQGIGRGWTVSGTAGYARSTSLARIVRSNRSQLVDQVFNSGFYSSTLSKRLGGVVSLILGYTLETQNSTSPICSTGLCQTFPLHHVVTAGLAFNPRPIKLN